MADYYKILGVPPGASAKEIDRAFYKLKSRFSTEDIDDTYFKKYYRRILEAYNNLSNEKLRSQYDKNYAYAKTEDSLKKDVKKSVEPVIDYFKTSKTFINEDEKIILSWNTFLADEIILMPFGRVSPIGSKIIYFNELEKDNSLFTLRIVNNSSGKEVSRDIQIQKSLKYSGQRKDKNVEPPRYEVEIDQDPSDILESNVENSTDLDKKRINKYVIPVGVGVLVIAIFLFALGKSGFWQSKSEVVPDNIISNLDKEDKEDILKDSSKAEIELFSENTLNLGGRQIQYYAPEDIFSELFIEIDRFTLPEIPGFKVDVRQFFNASNNPLEWEITGFRSGNVVFNSEIIVGLKQELNNKNRNKIVEKLHLSKIGDPDSRILKTLKFRIEDSGPPYWEPDNKWEAFQNIFKSDFEKFILTDQLNQKREVYGINQIPEGYSKGYILRKDASILPVSFSKSISNDYPTSIEISLYASMNSLMEAKENLSRSEKEERILNLLELENYKDFPIVSQFYADNVFLYWDNRDLDYLDLKTLYHSAWTNSTYSKNEVQDIIMLDSENFEVITDFKYENKEQEIVSNRSSIHYSFNEKGLITEVFPVNSDHTYKDFRDDDFDNMEKNEKLKRLLQAEDDREFYKIASYYAADMKRYWHVKDPTFNQLKNIYEGAWEASSNSRNILLNIKESAYNTYDVEVRFVFYNNKENRTEERISFTRYVFNENGLITEVYGLKDNQL